MSLTSSAHPAPGTYANKRRHLQTSQNSNAAAKCAPPPAPSPPGAELPGFEFSLRLLPSDSEPQHLACMAFL